ncbi:MAG: D-arabinose 5-phosphate isomerase [Bacteroidetes bacterium]|nr:D-arabinose 5-phosphate isomerase [Bacteroidota bacterium]
MKKKEDILHFAKDCIQMESDSIAKLASSLDADFVELVKMLSELEGKIVVSGIGKSAYIARKIASTLSSTGSPAIFMHTADALHGDMGIIGKSDAILMISNSGNTPEFKVLIPLLKKEGNLIIAMTAKKDSYLTQHADHLIHANVDQEICPHNISPTVSATAQLVLGDVLAVSLARMKGVELHEMGKFHPGGMIGKSLYLKVGDLYLSNENPRVDLFSSVEEVICEISSKRLGATAVLEGDKLCGIITDGDIRRMLHNPENLSELKAKDVMSVNPKLTNENELLVNALQKMRSNNISQLLVMDGESYLGMIHLHDILKEGII